MLVDAGGGSVTPAVTDESGITARVGTTPGSGTVTIYEAIGTPLVLTTTGEEVTCYNVVTDTVADDTYILMDQDKFGNWWVVVEDCPPVGL